MKSIKLGGLMAMLAVVSMLSGQVLSFADENAGEGGGLVEGDENVIDAETGSEPLGNEEDGEAEDGHDGDETSGTDSQVAEDEENAGGPAGDTE